MSGIINSAGSKNGLIGYVKNEWKLCNETNLNGFGASVLNWTVSNGIKLKTFLRYKIILSGIQNHTGSQAALQFTWSCTSGATTGYASGGYHGGRWTHGHTAGFTSAAESDANYMRVCMLNASSDVHGHSQSEINIENLGVSADGSLSGHSRYIGAFATSIGYVHTTTTGAYAPVVSGNVNNHNATLSTADGGEITAMTVSLGAGNFDKGYARLYGFVK